MQPDEALVDRARSSDSQAADELIRRYESAAYATAFGVLREHHLAEDVVQDSFLIAFRKLSTLRDGRRFGSWLLSIARREAVQMAKRRRRTAQAESAGDRTSLSQAIEYCEISNHSNLIAAVAKLPEHERVAIALKNFEGHSVHEIAEITHRPVGTVTKQLSRAYARLRKLLKEVTHERQC